VGGEKKFDLGTSDFAKYIALWTGSQLSRVEQTSRINWKREKVQVNFKMSSIGISSKEKSELTLTVLGCGTSLYSHCYCLPEGNAMVSQLHISFPDSLVFQEQWE
jgi:hypothetical protein